MEKFTTLRGVAAPMPMTNIDTDMIIPKNFLKTIKRTGLKDGLFYEMRWTADGQKKDFILDQSAYQNAKIIVAGPNFGCGSSREHAPWALLDFGIRCVIAPSFGDIFANNSGKNGLLPVVLPDSVAAAIREHETYLQTEHLAQKRSVENWQNRLVEMLRDALLARAHEQLGNGTMARYAAEVAEHKRDPYSLVEEIVSNLGKG